MATYQHKAIPDDWVKAQTAKEVLLEETGRDINVATIFKWVKNGRIAYRKERNRVRCAELVAISA